MVQLDEKASKLDVNLYVTPVRRAALSPMQVQALSASMERVPFATERERLRWIRQNKKVTRDLSRIIQENASVKKFKKSVTLWVNK